MDLLLTPECQTQQHLSSDPSTSHPQQDVTPDVTEATDPTPKSLTADRLQALLRMQKTDPFCKCKYLNVYQMEKPLSMKLISSYIQKDYSANTSLILIKNC